MKLYEIDEAIKKVCPIHGISGDGTIWFKDEATEEQKAKARDIYAKQINDCDEIKNKQ